MQHDFQWQTILQDKNYKKTNLKEMLLVSTDFSWHVLQFSNNYQCMGDNFDVHLQNS